MSYFISGIQQIGIGVADVHASFAWYRRAFGTDVPMFDEAAEAGLMLPYTDGKPQARHAILAVNLNGGGGFEIWQYRSRKPQPPAFVPQLGDTGIFVAKVKAYDVAAAHAALSAQGAQLLGPVMPDPQGKPHFYLQDPHGNCFEVVEGVGDWFIRRSAKATGAVAGCVIAVSDMGRALPFYQRLLGYDVVVYDRTGVFEDLGVLPGGNAPFRRVLLAHSAPRVGAFSEAFGQTHIELVQDVSGRSPRALYQGRLWGDLGFIHLCFDIHGMADLRAASAAAGHPFTVDSAESFDMGQAAGHFAYVEDPDGTLIEFVETHKIPILKKIGWYMNLRTRDPRKPLPRWMLRALNLTRIRD